MYEQGADQKKDGATATTAATVTVTMSMEMRTKKRSDGSNELGSLHATAQGTSMGGSKGVGW